MSTARIQPKESPYSEAVAQALDRLMPPGVPPLVLFRTMAVNERVFTRLMAGGFLDRGTISLRDREIVIDRTCFRCGAEYEWGVHVRFFGDKAGLSPEEIVGLTTLDVEQTVFGARDRLLLRLADELHDTSTLGGPLYAELERIWSAEQLLELVAVAGYYHSISFIANAFRLPLEPGAARYPR